MKTVIKITEEETVSESLCSVLLLVVHCRGPGSIPERGANLAIEELTLSAGPKP